MAQHDPFTLDLFDNTSLSSGLGLGVTAFPSAFEPDGDDAEAPSIPQPRRHGELGRDRHHPQRLQVHSGSVRL